MKKQYIGYYIAGHFYSYSVYEVTDAMGKKLYLAEPAAAGATRTAGNLPDLYYQLEKDVWMLNYIAKESQRKHR